MSKIKEFLNKIFKNLFLAIFKVLADIGLCYNMDNNSFPDEFPYHITVSRHQDPPLPPKDKDNNTLPTDDESLSYQIQGHGAFKGPFNTYTSKSNILNIVVGDDKKLEINDLAFKRDGVPVPILHFKCTICEQLCPDNSKICSNCGDKYFRNDKACTDKKEIKTRNKKKNKIIKCKKLLVSLQQKYKDNNQESTFNKKILKIENKYTDVWQYIDSSYKSIPKADV